MRRAGLLNATLMALACIFFAAVVQGPVVLTMFFYSLRFLGQGGMQLIGTNLISNWWIRRRGLMQGISGVGLSLSMTGLFPVLARLSCEAFGWRLTFVGIGMIMICLFLPVCSIFFLDAPEMYGLLPDAVEAEAVKVVKEKDTEDGSGPREAEESKEAEESAGGTELEGKTLGEAMRTLDFWAATGSCFTWAFIATGMFFHLIMIVETDLSLGKGGDILQSTLAHNEMLPSSLVPHVYLTCAISSSTCTLLIGYLFDRMNPKWILSESSFSAFLFCLLTFSISPPFPQVRR